MGSMEQLHLRWNDFESNIKLGFSELRQDEDFYDVTLACESKQIKAHKVILSACSPFFRSLIKSVSHAHPLLYLRGIKFSHLEALLSFMYNGEVNVTQEELTEFLFIAEELKIRGLTQEGFSSSSSGTVVPKEETPTSPPNKRPRLNHKPASNAPSLIKPGSSRDSPEPISSDDIEILTPIKIEHSQSLSQQSSSSKHVPPSYDTEFHEEKYIPEDEESANFLSRVEDGMEAEEDVDFLNSEEHSSSFTSDHPTPIAPMNENEGGGRSDTSSSISTLRRKSKGISNEMTRRIVILTMEGIASSTIAKILGLPPSTVRTVVSHFNSTGQGEIWNQNREKNNAKGSSPP